MTRVTEPRPELRLTFDRGVLVKAELRSLISGYLLAEWRGVEHIPDDKSWQTTVIMFPPAPDGP